MRVPGAREVALLDVVDPVEVGGDEEVGRRAVLDLLGERVARRDTRCTDLVAGGGLERLAPRRRATSLRLAAAKTVMLSAHAAGARASERSEGGKRRMRASPAGESRNIQPDIARSRRASARIGEALELGVERAVDALAASRGYRASTRRPKARDLRAAAAGPPVAEATTGSRKQTGSIGSRRSSRVVRDDVAIHSSSAEMKTSAGAPFDLREMEPVAAIRLQELGLAGRPHGASRLARDITRSLARGGRDVAHREEASHAFSRRRNELLQLPALVHLAHDVAAADELAVHVELRDRGPVGVLLDAFADLGVLQHVDGEDLARARTA